MCVPALGELSEAPQAPRCEGIESQFGEAEEWATDGGARAAEMGPSHHSTQGPLAIQGESITLHGKFAYGMLSKDLEGEVIRIMIGRDDCALEEVGTATTDTDGRIAFEIPAQPLGLHDYWLVVAGDLTFAKGTIAVLPRGARIAIFDIDGTLTTDDGEVFEELLLNSTPEMHPGGDAVANFYAQRGVQPIYITGRAYQLQGPSRDWLETQGLPWGPLHTTDDVLQVLPGDNVREYKLAFLSGLVERGFDIVAAYGNASSDVCAYAEAGISTCSTFIIGENAGTACEGHEASQPVSSYPEHLEALLAE